MTSLNEMVIAEGLSFERKWIQKTQHDLTPEQLAVKLAMDVEWENGCTQRGTAFYLNRDGSRRAYTPEEYAVFQANETVLWDEFEARAIAAGLYYEVTIDEQIAEAQAVIEMATARVSHLTEVKAELVARAAAEEQGRIAGGDVGTRTPGEITMPGAKGL